MLLAGDVLATQFPEASNDRTAMLDGLKFYGDPDEIPVGRFTIPFVETTTVAPSQTRPGRRYKRDCLPGFMPASSVAVVAPTNLSVVTFTTNPDNFVNNVPSIEPVSPTPTQPQQDLASSDGSVDAATSSIPSTLYNFEFTTFQGTTNTATDSNDTPSILPVTGGGPIEGATTPSSLPVTPTLLPVVGAPRPTTTTTTSSVPEIPIGNDTPSTLPVTAISTGGGPDAPTTTTPSVPEIPPSNDIPSVLPVTATGTGGGPIQGTSRQLDGVATPPSIPDAPTTTTPSVPETPAGNDIPTSLHVIKTQTQGASSTARNDPQVAVVPPITTSTSKAPPPTPSVPTPTVLTVFDHTSVTPDPQIPTPSRESVAAIPTTTASAAGANRPTANENGVPTPSSEHVNAKPAPSTTSTSKTPLPIPAVATTSAADANRAATGQNGVPTPSSEHVKAAPKPGSSIFNAANVPIAPSSSEHVAPSPSSIAPHITGDIGTTAAHTTGKLTTDPVVVSSAKFLARQVTMDDGEVCVPILEFDPTEDQSTASATPVTLLQIVSGVIQTVVTTETPTPIPSPFTSVFLTSISGNLETVITVVTPTAPTSQNQQDPVTYTFLTSISGTLQTEVIAVTPSPTPTSFTTITFVTSISGIPHTEVTVIPAFGQAKNPTFSITTSTRVPITILLDWPSSTMSPSLQTSGGGYSIAKYREKLSIWIGVLYGFIIIGMTLI